MKCFLLTIVFLTACIECDAQAMGRVIKTEMRDAVIHRSAKTRSGDFIWYGDGYHHDTLQVFLLKTDADMNVIWFKIYPIKQLGFSSVDQFYGDGFGGLAITQSDEVIFAHNFYNIQHLQQVGIVKTDQSGDVVWSKLISEWNYCRVNNIDTTSDGGIVFTGYTHKNDSNRYDLIVGKLSSGGNLLWSKALNFVFNDYGVAIKEDRAKNLIVLSRSELSNSSYSGFVGIISLSQAGQLLWKKKYTAGFNFFVHDIDITASNEMIISGWLDRFPGILKTNSLGNFIWAKRFQFDNHDGGSATNTILTSDSKLFFLSYLSWDRAWTKASLEGIVEYSQLIDQTELFTIVEGPDHFVFGGATSPSYLSFNHPQLIRTDSSGNSNCSTPVAVKVVDTTMIPGTFSHFMYDWGVIKDISVGSVLIASTSENTCCQKTRIDGVDEACVGDTVTLTGIGGDAYHWNTNDSVSSISFVAWCNNNYIVDIQNECGVGTDTLFFKANPVPPSPIVSDVRFCEGSPVHVSANGLGLVTWFSDPECNDSISSGNSLSLSSSSPFTVYCTGKLGSCESSPTEVSVSINPTPTAFLECSSYYGRAPIDVVFYNNSTGEINFCIIGNDTIWGNTFTKTFTIPGTYDVAAYSVIGECSAVTRKRIEVKDPYYLEIPNFFTPNEDGQNDVFKIDSGGIKTFSLSIFNRWGEQLYHTVSPTDQWDGNGTPDGTYYYVVKLLNVHDKEEAIRGFFTLQR